jgi:putative transposase
MMGTRKLHYLISNEIKPKGFMVGRDKLFSILRKEQLLIRRKRRYALTTQSHHRFHRFGNLIKGWKPTGPDQLIVADITYLRLMSGFCYLCLITDAYSRKIVGWDLSHSLGISGSMKAASMAVKQCLNPEAMIHHSDHGIQYCSKEYIEQLSCKGIKLSMGEIGNCYENALAERMNGILKQEYGLYSTFKDLPQAYKAVKEAINLYNEKRPHLALNYKTPSNAHKAA